MLSTYQSPKHAYELPNFLHFDSLEVMGLDFLFLLYYKVVKKMCIHNIHAKYINVNYYKWEYNFLETK